MSHDSLEGVRVIFPHGLYVFCCPRVCLVYDALRVVGCMAAFGVCVSWFTKGCLLLAQ